MNRNGILTLLAFLFLVIPVTVKADQYGDFTYSTDGTNVTITGYTGANATVSIPDMINGLPVTTIGTNAFVNCSTLTAVTIGTNVVSIADKAFFLTVWPASPFRTASPVLETAHSITAPD